jgi:lipopolysaccharide transport system permease protein
MSTVVIQPQNRLALPSLAIWWHYRDLLMEMVKRDIRIRYRQTLLGWLWVIIQPVTQSLMYGFVFGIVAGLKSPSGGSYMLFVLVNLLGWGFFTNSLSRGVSSFIGQAALIKKVYFPRSIIPLATMLSSSVDSLVIFITILLLLLFDQGIQPERLLLLPVWALLLVLIALGASFWMASLAAYYRDFRNATGMILQFWMYLTPVVYSETVVPPLLRPIIDLNPITAPVLGIRYSLLGSDLPAAISLISSLTFGVILFVSGLVLVNRVERTMVDVL